MKNCVFCKIIEKDIPADIVYEDNDVVAFHDRAPLAPVHVLVIPKKHIASIVEITDADESLMGHMILVAKKIADDFPPEADQPGAEKISEKGYKLLFRVGEHGGQEVGHIHLHLIGGARLSEGIGPIH
jgi:histidine triad (HIT) family protein